MVALRASTLSVGSRSTRSTSSYRVSNQGPNGVCQTGAARAQRVVVRVRVGREARIERIELDLGRGHARAR